MKSNQSWKSNSNPEWNARDGKRARVWSKRRKRVSKNERRRRQENIEGAWKNGWLAVLADQISRMVRAPLNRSYFRSCSERARLTRRKTFDECPREPLQEDSSILSFPPPISPTFCARKIDLRITPEWSRTIALDLLSSRYPFVSMTSIPKIRNPAHAFSDRI